MAGKKKAFVEPKVIELRRRTYDDIYNIWVKLRLEDWPHWSWYSGRWVCVGTAKTKSLARKKAKEFEWSKLKI